MPKLTAQNVGGKFDFSQIFINQQEIKKCLRNLSIQDKRFH